MHTRVCRICSRSRVNTDNYKIPISPPKKTQGERLKTYHIVQRIFLAIFFSSSTFKFSWFDIVAAGRQKLANYWMSWLWGIACNYLRIIAQRNTISATYNVSCCKISVKFITWLRVKISNISFDLLEPTFNMAFDCVHIINALINRGKSCRYFS